MLGTESCSTAREREAPERKGTEKVAERRGEASTRAGEAGDNLWENKKAYDARDNSQCKAWWMYEGIFWYCLFFCDIVYIIFKCYKTQLDSAAVICFAYKVKVFVHSLLWSGVQPTLDPSAETFMSVQCASPGRGEELVGVCGVCAACVGWRKA